MTDRGEYLVHMGPRTWHDGLKGTIQGFPWYSLLEVQVGPGTWQDGLMWTILSIPSKLVTSWTKDLLYRLKGIILGCPGISTITRVHLGLL